jgi:hypothetical protein
MTWSVTFLLWDINTSHNKPGASASPGKLFLLFYSVEVFDHMDSLWILLATIRYVFSPNPEQDRFILTYVDIFNARIRYLSCSTSEWAIALPRFFFSSMLRTSWSNMDRLILRKFFGGISVIMYNGGNLSYNSMFSDFNNSTIDDDH